MNLIHLIMGVLLLSSFSLSLFAQNPGRSAPVDTMKKAMELREELHRRLMDHLFHGSGKEDEIFKDMDALFEDVMSGMDSDFGAFMGEASKNYDMAWTENKDGRTLLISPHEKNQSLELNVEKGMVNIKGQTSTTSFTHIYSVPQDCDWTKVKMLERNGKILMSFPFKNTATKKAQKPEKNERKPVAPSKTDIPI